MDDRTTVRAAYLYHRAGLTQAQVGDRLGLSRAKVNRLLASAERRGIVQVRIAHPLSRATEAEVALEARFGLRDAVVAQTAAEDEHDEGLRLLAVAAAGARFLASLELAGSAIAVGWGTTMQAVAEALDDGWASGMEVHQLNGAVPVSGYANGAGEIMARFARLGGGEAHVLQVPAVVGTREVRAALESDHSVRAALEGAARAPVAMFSLGRLTRESVLVSSGYIAPRGIDELGAAGAAGDVISRFIRADGSLADPDLDARTMGVELGTLRARERSIGIAAGVAKTSAVRAALAGGYLDTLVVDEALARALLEGEAA
ncbi:sugar-binding transcriptional regulator [Homoserinibacter sp. YIM 151385]|uniref:sugar-binding transcriptional regulator n=1 Tax=Homoserinibacter sp. YIM 151385 TaxID=2985506 RepID=UPI0022F0D556|nr:sugar-binding domain-containing protein [Homoserinibacter sp. YIM 151385]WBU39250.1 winged helix-turn-helix transcriptional regulator [Homoserinibacter sp. YIM 151385]